MLPARQDYSTKKTYTPNTTLKSYKPYDKYKSNVCPRYGSVNFVDTIKEEDNEKQENQYQLEKT